MTEAEKILNEQDEAEVSVLGALMIAPELYPKAAEIIDADDFSNKTHKRIFEAMGKSFGKHETIDPIMVLNSVPVADEKSKTDLREYILRLTESVPDAWNVVHYCDIVKKRSIGRKAMNILSGADFKGISGADIVETVQDAAEKLSELVRGKGRAKMQAIGDVLHEIYQDVFVGNDDASIKTGFTALDRLLDGIYPGDLVTIGAGTAVGKTAFVLQIIANMAKSGKKVILYSQEMDAKQNVQRIVSRLSGVELRKLRRPDRTNGDEKKKILEAFGIANKYVLNISAEGGLRVSDIRLDCVAQAWVDKSKNIDVIVVDHVGLMRGEKNTRQGRTEELTQIMVELRALALQIHKPVIVLAQFNREAKPEVSKNGKMKYSEPQLFHFKDSGEVEQSSSTVILMWRLPGYDDDKSGNYSMVGIKVAKNRQAETGKFYLRFDAPIMNFREVIDFKPKPGFIPSGDNDLDEILFE
jgi:replicative DNA helicase